MIRELGTEIGSPLQCLSWIKNDAVVICRAPLQKSQKSRLTQKSCQSRLTPEGEGNILTRLVTLTPHPTRYGDKLSGTDGLYQIN